MTALQPYRLDGGVTRMSGNFNLPKEGMLEIPNIWQPGINSFKPGRENPRLAADAKPASSEHIVKPQDSLWKIAKHALHEAGDLGASGTQIAHKVQSIIQANKGENPGLGRYPNEIKPGMKLQIPGHEAAGEERGQNTRTRAEGRPERDEARRNRGERLREGRKTDGDPLPGDKAREVKPKAESDRNDFEGDGGKLAKAMKKFGQDIADTAVRIANKLGTIGDCARGPRLTFSEYDFHLPPAIATRQGRMVHQSGLFHEVPRDEVRPGDYGVRDWNKRVTKAHGVNKGDSFIVTNVGANGSLRGANDHNFRVPEDGGRYRNLKFYRPTPEFFKKYGPGANS